MKKSKLEKQLDKLAPEKTYPLKTIMEYLKMVGLPHSRKWLYVLEKRGKIPSRRNKRGHRVYTIDDCLGVIEYLENRS